MESVIGDTIKKALEEEAEYRKNIDSLPTWGEKLRLSYASPSLVSLFYQGSQTLLVNIHGGGFSFKHPTDNDDYCHYINKTYCVSVLNVDYTSAAKFCYPVQLYEIEAEIDGLLRLYPDKTRIILAGHSSGANLAVSLAIMMAKRGKVKPYALILDYPYLDLSVEAKDRPWREGQWSDFTLDTIADIYSPALSSRKNPAISPLYLEPREVRMLPPSYVVCCENDRLAKDAKNFVALLGTNKVRCRYYLSKEHHGFIERNMQNVYHLPNDPNVKAAKTVVDQELVYVLTLKN